jgi:hypothetical protein
MDKFLNPTGGNLTTELSRSHQTLQDLAGPVS